MSAFEISGNKNKIKMAVSTVVRVKRARTEHPVEAIVVSSKRRKHDETDEKPVTTVLKFAGTLGGQEENVRSQISKAFLRLKKEAKEHFKTHVPKMTEKLREQLKTKWQEERFKVVNFYRCQNSTTEESSSKEVPENITIVEIESTMNEEISDDCTESLGNYEYDLYYTESAADICPGVLETVLSVQPLELVNEGELSPDEDIGEDSDNEDDENNWRNDYPEEQSSEEEDKSTRHIRHVPYDEDDELMERMQNFGIGSGVELSSDEDDEHLIYGRPASPFEQYRSRSLRQLHDTSSESDRELNYDSYGGDSD